MCEKSGLAAGILLCLLLTPLASARAGTAPRGTICGRVVAASGPVDGAGFELLPVLDNYERSLRLSAGRGRPDPVASASSDSEGRFCLTPPVPGVWRLVAKAEGFVPMEYFPLPLADGGEVELPPARLLPDARTTVSTDDRDGRPLAAAVYALPGETAPWSGADEQGWRVASRFGWSGRDGRLVLPRAEGELLDLYVNRRGTARIERAKEMENTRFFLPAPAGSSLGLRIVSHGEPVPEAVVGVGEVAWPVGLTDSAGRLTISGLRRRVLSLTVLSAEGAVVRKTVDCAALPPGKPVTIGLPGRRPVAVRVVDDAGRPIVGALVWVGEDPGRFALSGHDGRLHLEVAEGHRFWLQGQAPHHQPETVWVEPRGAATRETIVRLARSLTIPGRSVDAEGNPLPGVDIVADETEAPESRSFRLDPRSARTRSDAHGRFSIEARAGGTYAVEASLEGYRTAKVNLGPNPEAEQSLIFRLERHHGGWGRVLDWKTRPAAGVKVWLLPAGARDRLTLETKARRDELDPTLASESDHEGVFRLDHLPATTIDLVAYGPGLAPTVVPGIRTSPHDGSSDLGTVILRQGVELTGRVVDHQGEPVPDASVRLLDSGQSISRQRLRHEETAESACRSGKDGTFRLADLAPATAVRLGLAAEGFRPAIVDLAEVDPQRTIEVILDRQGLLRGTVHDPEGRPVSGALVTVSPKAGDAGSLGDQGRMEEERSAMTDEQGAFEVDELRGGAYRLEAFRDGYLSSAERTVVLVPGTPLEGVDLRLRTGASVEGRVLAESGEPVEGAVVIFGRPATRTGADGSFLVEGVEPGPTTVEVRHPDFVWLEESREIEPGENAIELRLHRGVGVSGWTLGPSGEPLEGVTVRWTRQARPSRAYRARSGHDGRFSIESVQPGPYRVEAARGALVPVEPDQEVEVGPGGVEDVQIRLRSGASIGGMIRGLDLDELARAQVVATNPERGSRRGSVDHTGEYRIDRVAPGVWWVRASLPGGTREAEERVVVEEDDTEVTRDLDMTTGLALRGVVLIDGEPSAEAQVSLRGLDRTISRSARTDLEGRFTFEGLPDGRYRLTASSARASLIHNEVVDLLDDLDVEVRIDSATVVGEVTSEATGEPLKDAVVTLGQLEGESDQEVSRVTLATDDGGGFRIAKLSAGRYRLAVRDDGYVPRLSDLEVAGGDKLALDLPLTPAAGLRLHVQESDGGSPAWAFVRLTDPRDGRHIEETRSLQGDRLEIPTAPPGVWDVMLAAPGGAPVQLRVKVPGEATDVTLPPASRLRLEAPTLDALDLEATVQVLDPAGHAIPVLDSETGTLGAACPWRRNGIVLGAVPSGQWVVRIVGSDGSTWVGQVVTSGRGEALVVVR